MKNLLPLSVTCLLFSAAYVLADASDAVSPLQVVMDGRDAAGSSNLTEAGARGLAQSMANVVLYVCGAVAIALTAVALTELYRASDGDAMYGGNPATKTGAVSKLIIAGLISIPAIIAAILPNAVLVE